jgi:LmbE family N-acetylglucosaminyl deacetylase
VPPGPVPPDLAGIGRLADPAADVHVPDGRPLAEALGRTTDLGIGAHPDDLELFALVPIAECLADPGRAFVGVTCTDGAGSAVTGRFADMTADQLIACRRDEQRRAADVGRYAAVLQLGHPSATVRRPDGLATLVDDLAAVLAATRPRRVVTHDLADKHVTHVAVGLATVAAVRRLPTAVRPERLLGVEGWRSLGWLGADEAVGLDATGHADLARRLVEVFRSQLTGKRYDLAEAGRRRANATLGDPRRLDTAEEASVAMDLTPLVVDDRLDPVAFVLAAVDRFRADVEHTLRDLLA